MLTFDDLLWFLHYEGEGEGEGEGQDPPKPEEKKDPPAGKFMTQEEIDKVVTKRTEKARRAQQQALEQLESLQQTVNMTEEQRETLESEIEKLRKQTLTAEEIRKREEKKAKEAYESKLTDATKSAQTWESRYNDLKINYEIGNAAQKHGVLGASVPFLEAFLRPQVKLTEEKDDETGEVRGHAAMVDFNDQGADGKPVQVQLSVEDTVKRMKELPEMYGHLFQAPSGGGLGGSSGSPGKKGGFNKSMSQEEYMRLRKENPSALYGQ